MTGKKDRLASLLARLGLTRALQICRDRLLGDLRVIAYHRVCDIDELNDRDLVSASVAEFDWQMAHIARHYHAMTFAALDACLRGDGKLPANAVIVTFDDGFRDNYVNAFPILRRHGVPATFFISSGYIGRRETFWFNLVARIINANPGARLALPVGEFTIPEARDARAELALDVLDRIKLVPNEQRLEIVDALRRDFDAGDECDPLALPMSWDEVREMADNGMEIGSHTVSHPILTQISAAQLHDEIHDSRREIEARIGRAIHSISYPEGLDYAYDGAVVEAVRAAGYSFAASYVPGTNYRPAPGNFGLRRAHIERYTGRDRFAAMLAVPELFQ